MVSEAFVDFMRIKSAGYEDQFLFCFDFPVVKMRAQYAKMNCPFVFNAGNILEPKRTITDVWLNQSTELIT